MIKFPFAEAKDLLVDFPVAPGGKCDVLIDDLITLGFHNPYHKPLLYFKGFIIFFLSKKAHSLITF